MKADACSLAALLPLDSFDPDGNVLVLRDGSIGLAWSIEQVESELAPKEALATLASRLDSLFRCLPTGAACQMILVTDRDVSERTQPRFPSHTHLPSPRAPIRGILLPDRRRLDFLFSPELRRSVAPECARHYR